MQREVAPPGNLAPRGKAARGGGRVRGTGGVVATLGVLVLDGRGTGAAPVVRGAGRGARVRGAGVGALGIGSRAAGRYVAVPGALGDRVTVSRTGKAAARPASGRTVPGVTRAAGHPATGGRAMAGAM